MPLFFTALGALALWFIRAQRTVVAVIVFIVLVAGVVPSPIGWPSLYSLYIVDYADINAYMPNRAYFDENWCDGCPEAEYIASHVAPDRKVYTYDLMNLTYLLRERGITNIGNLYSSFDDKAFIASVEARDLRAYVERFSVGAFLININSPWPNDSHALFTQQVQALGFHEYEYPRPRKDGHISIYTR